LNHEDTKAQRDNSRKKWGLRLQLKQVEQFLSREPMVLSYAGENGLQCPDFDRLMMGDNFVMFAVALCGDANM